MGPGWELAKVRGTRFNTGDAIRMALDIGAAATGNWSGCHAVAWDRYAPETGDLAVGDGFQKHSYPWGVYINAEGKRFVDEGADFRNYTYAKYGRVILQQPKQFAWQIFDAKVKAQLRDEYRIKQVTKISGNTLEELVSRMDDTDQKTALDTLKKYNAAVRTDVPFNPNVKDGRCTEGLEVNKSNWANTLDTPPYEAYAVTCGITFSFGGLKINTAAQGYLVLQVPKDWRDRVSWRHLLMPPTITFAPASGEPFQVLVTPIWPSNAADKPKLDELKRDVAAAAEKAKSQAAEKTLPLVSLKGGTTSGYFFAATDRAPKADEFKYIVQGMLGLEQLRVSFTVLTNDGRKSVPAEALAMLREARLDPAGMR